MEVKMTIGQVIETTIKLLGEIQVPMALFDQIGIPIKCAISNLDACLIAERQKKAAGSGDEPQAGKAEEHA